MQYADFFAKFGGSARTKHLTPDSLTPPDALHRILPKFNRDNKRFFPIPAQSGLPKNYIRLCPWEMEYVYCIARQSRLGILEVGRFNGGSTFLMSCANPKTPIHSIDIAPQNDDLLRSYFQQHGVGGNVNMIVGDSQHTQYDSIGQVDVLFIDGDHTYEGCKADIDNWYGKLVPGGHILFHDSYIGRWGVQEAIADFMREHTDVEIAVSPFIGPTYWHLPAGSIAHLVKRR